MHTGQRATIAVEIEPLFAAEALERKAAAGRSAAPGRATEKDTAIVPEVSHGETREYAVRTAGILEG
jgi:hypothetical protein